jgi:hypothetical protein
MTLASTGGWTPPPVTNAYALTENTTGAPGRAIMITATGAGTVTLTLAGGTTIVVNPVVGDNIYPFAVSKATVGTATVGAYYNLF